ncbi:uncharacterized protein K444DRAFT_612021 [Hyaloscypha bicolor E]|uniref:Uncharacterized protein n=1 Tax=Hyaloscypha bicolor E TaxID=1095630 RepID=A0A2J6TFI8_9HELO|nr:uncharacterized protein K444DRAFT_612021 [Hyaloscypha bicolor E]PMD61784.1 hypothetical protein K444DRAFT_612021 [Hyaloscypha bicolor E]
MQRLLRQLKHHRQQSPKLLYNSTYNSRPRSRHSVKSPTTTATELSKLNLQPTLQNNDISSDPNAEPKPPPLCAPNPRFRVRKQVSASIPRLPVGQHD